MEHAEARTFTKSNTPLWVLFTFLKLHQCTKSRKASQRKWCNLGFQKKVVLGVDLFSDIF